MKQLFGSLSRRGTKRAAPGRKALDWRRRPTVETLEDRTTPSITFSGGVITLGGTPGPDNFRISLVQQNSTTSVEVSDGHSTQDFALSSVTGIVVNGEQGNDVLTIDNSNGLVGSSSNLSITFNGGPPHGFDTLEVTGTLNTGTVTETFTAGTSTTPSTLQLSDGTNSTTISLNQVSAVLDTLKAPTVNATVQLNNNGNIAVLSQGPSIAGTQTLRLQSLDRFNLDDTVSERMVDQGPGDNGPGDKGGHGHDHDDLENNLLDNIPAGEGFPTLVLGNVTNLTINLGNGSNFLEVNLPHAPAGLSSITINGGTGQDVLALRAIPSNITFTPTTAGTNGIEKILTDADDIFIEELYELDLGRDADAAGFAGWQGLLRRDHNLLEIVQGIDGSEEAREQLVRQLYRHYLGRDADQGGLQAFTNALMRGETEEQILSFILASPEFYQHAQQLFPSAASPNEAYVDALYQLILDRTPSPQEVSSFLKQLPANPTFQDLLPVAETFVESNEFQIQMAFAGFTDVLHRAIDQGGFDFFAHNRLNLEEVREIFLASQEFHDNG